MVLGFVSFSLCSFLEAIYVHVLLDFMFLFIADIYYQFVASELILVFFTITTGDH